MWVLGSVILVGFLAQNGVGGRDDGLTVCRRKRIRPNERFCKKRDLLDMPADREEIAFLQRQAGCVSHGQQSCAFT